MDNTIEVTTEEKTFEKRVLPKNAFDSEYMTEYLREVRFLTERGIKYTFVRKTPEYNISQYKYKKTPALFAALIEFYSMLEAERNVRKPKKFEKKELSPDDLKIELSPDAIKKAQEILEKAAKIVEKDEPVKADDTI